MIVFLPSIPFYRAKVQKKCDMCKKNVKICFVKKNVVSLRAFFVTDDQLMC